MDLDLDIRIYEVRDILKWINHSILPQPLPQLIENLHNHEKCASKHRARRGETHDFEIPVFAE